MATMERNVKQRIDPMLDESPRLKAKVGVKRSKDGGNTLHQKDFAGGVLVLTGANSAAGLRSIAVRVAVMDEVDGYPGDVDGEGDPVSLVEKRMVTFGNSKKEYILSTPTIEGQSRIEKSFELTDQRYYHVPCPHCEGLQVLVFERLKWVKGDYKDVYYECEHCSGHIYNYQKTWMLRDKAMGGTAEWRSLKPENDNPEVRGYHLSALYSPDGWLSWTDIARDWDESENDEPKRKVFINTILGKTYRIKGEAPPWQLLYERSQMDGLERNVVWESVAFLTAGADVQMDRIEVEIVGWMEGRRSQQIDYRVLMGDTMKEEVWRELDKVLEEEWAITHSPHPQSATRVSSGHSTSGEGGRQVERGGRVLKVRLMGLDTGYNAPMAHDFAKKWGTRRVIPIKGSDALEMPFSSPKAVTITKLGKPVGKSKVWMVGVSYLKMQLYGWLRLPIDANGEVPNGYCMFLPQDAFYFRGLTAEELVPKRSHTTNATSYEWIKRYERNEPLDCRIYATAVAYVLGFERWSKERWDKERWKPSLSLGSSPIPNPSPQVGKEGLDEQNDENEREMDSYEDLERSKHPLKVEKPVKELVDNSDAEKIRQASKKAAKGGKKGGSFGGRRR